jgi:hypothetical protein
MADWDDLPPEGDLDPDLAEDGDWRWEPPRRRWRTILLPVVSFLVIAGLVVPVVLRALAG